MADKQIAGLTAGTIGLTDVLPFQDAAAASEAKKTTVQDIIDLVPPPTTGVESVTGYAVDNTDPLNPIVNKFTGNNNVTATGTNSGTAAAITTVFSRITAGGAETGVVLPTFTTFGDKYYIYNVTDSTKKVYADVDLYVNAALVVNVTLLPYTAYSFTYMIGGVIVVNQEQVAPYKVYSFYAEQFSTNAPVVNEEQNTTGATITWSRVSTGRIRGTASSAIFTANKTTVLISGNGGDVNSPVLLMPVVVSTTVIDIVSYSSSFVKQDGFNLSGEIKIYP